MTNVSEFPPDIQWKPIVGYKQFYEVSNYGHVRTLQNRKSVRAGYILRPKNERHGYQFYRLTKNGEAKSHFIHRLVYRAFIGVIPNHQEIDHIDSNKRNNHCSNLQLLTHKENIEKANRDGRFFRPIGSQMHNAKLTEKTVIEARKMYRDGVSVRVIAAKYGVSHVAIVRAVHGHSWKHVVEQQPLFSDSPYDKLSRWDLRDITTLLKLKHPLDKIAQTYEIDLETLDYIAKTHGYLGGDKAQS